MNPSNPVHELVTGIRNGAIVPYLGPGVLTGVVNVTDGSPIPADSDSLIFALNGGQAMAPRLMYEFPRAAMNIELKKGRKYVERFLTETYGEKQWTASVFHRWLAEQSPAYVIDTNRDTQLQQCYGSQPHNLIVGMARISGTDYRFKIFTSNGNAYKEVSVEAADTSLPILFKPMGTPIPEPQYIASDADYVDYITELMGGFGIPAFIKGYRKNKKYLFLGMRFSRDTERMILSDMIYDSAQPAGWALIPQPSDKERRYCEKKHIQVIDADWDSLLKASDTLKASA